MLYHTSSPALKATIVAFMRTQGCASGVLDEHVPPPSSDAFNTLLATALAAASISDTRPVIAQTVTRVASSPLSPKRRANVNLLQEFSSTPSPGTAALQESLDSDGEAEAVDGESFSPARQDDTTDTIVDDADAPATMDPILADANETAVRIHINSDIALAQASFPLSHAAAAEANVTGSCVPDSGIVCRHTKMPDLIRTHSYMMHGLWAVRYLIVLVLRDCSPGDFDTSRIRAIFADEASLDRHIARRIRELASLRESSPTKRASPINAISIGIADASIAVNALAILLECITFDYDPTNNLNAKISLCNFTIANDQLHLEGLDGVLQALDEIAKLPPATLASLDFRSNFKGLALQLLPLRHFTFKYHYRNADLDWTTFVAENSNALRANGTLRVSLESFSDLCMSLDDFAGASTDFANSFRKTPTPTNTFVAACAPPTPPANDRAALLARIDALEKAELKAKLARLAAYEKASASASHAVAAVQSPKPSFPQTNPHQQQKHRATTQTGRGKAPSKVPLILAAQSDPAPRYAPPRRNFSAPKVACTDPACGIFKHAWWTNCHCGAHAVDLVACRLCPGQPLSVGSCNYCFVTFTNESSRPLDIAEDSEKLKTLSHAARTGNMAKLLPTRAPRRSVNALTIAASPSTNALTLESSDYDPLDVDTFLEMYDERLPYTDQLQQGPLRLFAFSSKLPTRKPSRPPCGPNILLPTSILDGLSNCLSTSQLVALGFSCSIDDSPRLTEPSKISHSLLPLTDGRPTLHAYIIEDPSGNYIGIGYPPGSGAPVSFLIDTCATTTIIIPSLAHILLNESPGGSLLLGDTITVDTIGYGDLPVRCFTSPLEHKQPLHGTNAQDALAYEEFLDREILRLSADITPSPTLPTLAHDPFTPTLAQDQAPTLSHAHAPTLPVPIHTQQVWLSCPCGDIAPSIFPCAQPTLPDDDQDTSDDEPLDDADATMASGVPDPDNDVPELVDHFGFTATNVRLEPLPASSPYAPHPYADATYPGMPFLHPDDDDDCPPTALSNTSPQAEQHRISGKPTYPVMYAPESVTNLAPAPILNTPTDAPSMSQPIPKHQRTSEWLSSSPVVTAPDTAPCILPAPLPHDTFTLTDSAPLRPTPGTSWTCYVSSTMTPYVDGARYDATFLDMTTGYPILTCIPNRSVMSLLEAIESLINELTTGDAKNPDIKVTDILLDQSWFEEPLDISDPRLASHMAYLQYSVSRQPVTRPYNSDFAADFPGFAAASVSHDDLCTLQLFYAAHNLAMSKLFEASTLLKRQARNRFICSTIPTPDGPMSRLQALTGSPLHAPLIENCVTTSKYASALFVSFPRLRLLLPPVLHHAL